MLASASNLTGRESALNFVHEWKLAFRASDLPSPAKHVLFELCEFMDKDGKRCFPSIQLLASNTGMGEKTVRRHLKVAVEKGWLFRLRHGKNGQAWANYHYQAKLPGEAKGAVRVTGALGKGAVTESQRSGHSVPKVRSERPLNLPLTTQEMRAGACERDESAHTPAHPSGKSEAERRAFAQEVFARHGLNPTGRVK